MQKLNVLAAGLGLWRTDETMVSVVSRAGQLQPVASLVLSLNLHARPPGTSSTAGTPPSSKIFAVCEPDTIG